MVFQDPRVDCGRQDFENVLDEFEFLFHPDPDVDSSILVFYVTEYLNAAKQKLYCLVSLLDIGGHG